MSGASWVRAHLGPRLARSRLFSHWSLRSPQYIAYGFLFTLVSAFLFFTLRPEQAEYLPLGMKWLIPVKTEQLEFQSPVAAYHLDLARIRKRLSDRSPHIEERAGAEHEFSPTGHLLLSEDPSASHPIPELLAYGEERWKKLLDGQSRSLAEAVAEYQRRYKRAPPKGFDAWWAFAKRNKVLLPDEYDRIHYDLAPFYGLSKRELRQRLREVENLSSVIILDVKGGDLQYKVHDKNSFHGTHSRARDLVRLLSKFASHLPDLRATFSLYDEPSVYVPWSRRESLIGSRESQPSAETRDVSAVDLSLLCPPESNLRRNSSMIEGKSFIYNALEASDICLNPYIVPLHGLTIVKHTPDTRPRPITELLPLFSLSKTQFNSDILMTPLEQFNDIVRYDRPWESKLESRLTWRGAVTGIAMMTKDVPWRQSHRFRLHKFANNFTDDEVKVLVPNVRATNDEHVSHTVGMRQEKTTHRILSDHFFDIKLTRGPLQCSKADGTCRELRKEILWAPEQSAADAYRSKFILDIDGNGWSGRFRRLMSSNSVIIKAGIFTEWFQTQLIPWYMYIPAKLDFSDLADTMAFFAGSPSHPGVAFDETARVLGHNGKAFVQKMFRIEDLQAYMFRLLLEYARIVADEGVDMDFRLERR